MNEYLTGKISLIVPFYNSKNTIEANIESVLAQTYKNFEAIYVNDGGTDESLEIVKAYAAKDPRIVVVDNVHSGVSATRNKGLEVATGDYIQFLDSDDTIKPKMMAKMVKAINKYNADLVVCNYTHPSIRNYLGDCVLNIENKADLLKYCQITFAMVVPWNKLYRKEAIVGKFDETVGFAEDDLFALTNLRNIKKVVSLKDKLYDYYVAPNEGGCIQSMAKKDDFWQTKKTYWYMRRPLVSKSLESLRLHLDEETAEDCAYARMFDFMIWEILLMDQFGSSREGITKEIINVFNEDEFKYAISLREKYGLKMKDFEPHQYNDRVRDFVEQCFIISDRSQKKEKFKAFYACLYLFIQLFLEPCGEIDESDLISRGYSELIHRDNKEAKYVLKNF